MTKYNKNKIHVLKIFHRLVAAALIIGSGQK